MVDQAIAQSVAAKKEPDAATKDAQMRAVEEILADHIANEIIS